MSRTSLDVVPIGKEAISNRVVSQLLGLVKAGNLKPGDRLPGERDLAATFGVSRPTIREALRALAVLGVLRVQHGGGIFVSPLEATDLLEPLSFFLTLRECQIDELYQARQLIEGEIAALAAGKSTKADCEELASLIEQQMAATGDPTAYRVVDTAFHRKLAEIAANAFLARAASSMHVLGLEFRTTASETRSVISGSIRDHRAILGALEEADAKAAREAMEGHMRNVLNSTKRSIADRRSQQGDGKDD